MRVPARPHAYAAGHLANSASLLLPVSNLTNLLAFAATGLSFLHFTGLMLGPWLVAVAVEFAVLRRLFRARSRPPGRRSGDGGAAGARPRGRRRRAVVVGFAVASGLGFSPIWPAVAGVVVLGVRQLVRRTTRVGDLLRAADLPFALFVLALAVVVLAVLRNGLERWLHRRPAGRRRLPRPARRRRDRRACWPTCSTTCPRPSPCCPWRPSAAPPRCSAMLIGVNVGPNLTYVGSLANLLWRRVLGHSAPPATRFSAVGPADRAATLLLSTAALWAALQV